MERRNFIIKSGVFITASMLSQNIITQAVSINEHDKNLVVNRRPDTNQFTTPILQALTYGINAPNPHNTQAWKFKIINDNEALFYADESRLLLSTDPLARQIQIGCGCFIGLFKIGASKLGYSTEVNYLPEGKHSLDEIGHKPIARLSLLKSNTDTDPLFNQIYKRQTNRFYYKGNLVTNKEFNSIVKLTKAENCQIEIENNKEKLDSLLLLLYKGMEVECFDYQAYDESRQWFRVKDDIIEKKDGINIRTNGVSGIKRWFAETMLSSYSKKTWHNEGGINSYLKSHYHAVMSSKGIVTFKTESNTQLACIKCGEDYARFQLAAFQLGFYIHPLSQVLQEFPSMTNLYSEFNLFMDVQTPQKIQMVVRIGRGKLLPYSYRRNTSDLIINKTAL